MGTRILGSIRLAAVAAAALSLAGCGGGASSDPFDIFPLWVTTDVAIADLDGDGRADVVTLAQFSTSNTQHEGRLYVYRQSAPMTFAAGDLYSVGTYPWRLRVVDLDRDGSPDILVTGPDDRRLWWLRQDPASAGRFLPAAVIASNYRVEDVAAGDLNGDGTLDVAFNDGMAGSNRVVVIAQDPAARGSFKAPVDVPAPAVCAAISVADLNADGRSDVVGWFASRATGATSGSGTLAYSLQGPGGSLGAFTQVATRTGLNARRLEVTDYLGNGRAGLIVFLTPQETGYTAELLVALQDPVTLAFGTLTGATLGGVQGIDDAAYGDLDGDGRVDAVVGGFFPAGSSVQSRLTRFRQLGNGSMQPFASIDMPISVSRVAAGDVDGDGRADIVAYGGQNEIRLLLQSKSAPGQFDAPRTLR